MMGYRKFTVAMFAITCATILMGMEKIADGVYSTIMVAVVATYLAANYLQNKTTEVTK